MIESVYIHIPFCNRICSYCDFSKVLYNNKYIDKYLNSLEFEIKEKYKGENIKTLYIGGGTPSSLNINELKKLFNILKIISKDIDIEFTIEVNIEDITKEKLEILKYYGINRLSIGVQTFNKKILSLMNRNTKIDYIEKINLAKTYFDNISVDLIYGFNNQEISDIESDLDIIEKLDIKHVSCYSLIVSENTKLYIDKYERIDDDKDYIMYKHICNRLETMGFIHYEISNFGKNNYFSKHNLCYWNNEHYYGFGLGASSYIDNVRRTNTRNLEKYINNNYDDYEEVLNKRQTMEYEMILALRKVEGVNKEYFYKKYNKKIKEEFDIEKLLSDKLLIENDNYIHIAKDKLYVENGILINFVGGSNEK